MMTFHIGLKVRVLEQHLELTPAGVAYPVDVLVEETTLAYWSNQVPEKGDYIKYWSADNETEYVLAVKARTWVLTGNTGGPRGTYDVEVVAEALT